MFTNLPKWLNIFLLLVTLNQYLHDWSFPVTFDAPKELKCIWGILSDAWPTLHSFFFFLRDAFWRMKLNFCDRKLRFYLNFLLGKSSTLQQPPQPTKKHWILLVPRFLCNALQKICILTGLLVTLYPVNMPVLRIPQIASLQKSKFSYDKR